MIQVDKKADMKAFEETSRCARYLKFLAFPYLRKKYL